MRNASFALPLVSLVSIAGSLASVANAGVSGTFVSIDDFQIASTAGGQANILPGGSFTDDTGAFGAATVRQTYGGGRFNSGTNGQAWATTAISDGVMTMSYDGVAASPSTGSQNYRWVNFGTWNTGWIGDQAFQPVQTAQALFAGSPSLDWSSGTNFSFDIAGFTTGGDAAYNSPLLTLFAVDNLGNFASTQVALANGHVDVNFSDFVGVDFSDLYYVAFQFGNTYSTALPKNTPGIPTGSLQISNFGYMAVPGPGAAALVGIAGLVARRRRTA